MKQDDRLPLAYFPPSNFVKDAFWKKKRSFFQQNTDFIFSNFSRFEMILISAKNPQVL